MDKKMVVAAFLRDEIHFLGTIIFLNDNSFYIF